MPLVGSPIQRVEDGRLLTGRGTYVNDVALPGMVHAAFVRSPHAHARIVRVDVDAARKVPGVVAVLTAADLANLSAPMQLQMAPEGFKNPVYHPLATDKVRHVGDPVVLVIGLTRYMAEDGCDAVTVEYEPLAGVSTIEQALDRNRPPLFDELGDNIVFQDSETAGDVDAAFGQADRVVRGTFRQHRYANVPMETRGSVASYDPTSAELTYFVSTQAPHAIRTLLSALLQQPSNRLRVIGGDVGGAFGLKSYVYREDVAVCCASKLLGRPVKWIEDRREHLMASGQAREEQMDIQAAVKNDGTLLGIKASVTMNQGAYPVLPFPSALFPAVMHVMLPGPYRLQAYSFDTTIVASNKASYVAYRAPWQMETFVRERTLDLIANELGLDPVEVRYRNLITAAEQPTHMITGPTLDHITARETLERAVALADVASFRDNQRRARASGRYLGLGIATYIEAAPGPHDGMTMGRRWGHAAAMGGLGVERATLRLEPDGTLTVFTAQMPHGQGHETTLAQIAADEMGLPLERVRVMYGDTLVAPFSMIGTGGSRAATMASGAVLFGTRALKEQVLQVAAGPLEARPEDLEIANGMVSVKGAPAKSMPLMQIAMMAYMAPGSFPPGTSSELVVNYDYDGGAGGWSQGTHCCWVEVDIRTGQVWVQRYLVVEDCGTLINPAIVEGQIRGGVAQGIGGALFEHAAYDDNGQFLSGNFHEYLVPTACEIPRIQIEHMQTASEDPVNFRGVGEGGALCTPAAVVNAIADALAPFNVRLTEQLLTPTRMLELLAAAK